MTGTELLPCPFCGVGPEKDGYGYYHEGDESLFIKCVNPGCRVRPAIIQEQSEYGEWQIDDAWNTRNAAGGESDSSLIEKLEAFRKTVKFDAGPSIAVDRCIAIVRHHEAAQSSKPMAENGSSGRWRM
ncbi:Lar family restriction alleviation protein [Fimbriiglobus ruber]|uniref:Lar family restriction alleviation protein n=1 Tax=Fimbriiglobus ruber TaxID=1908690 RepID=UPI00117B35D4|nr:Lar family restriction alleviation protein [Fimbriiglobus ruber]